MTDDTEEVNAVFGLSLHEPEDVGDSFGNYFIVIKPTRTND